MRSVSDVIRAAYRSRTRSSSSSRHSFARWAIRTRNSASDSPGRETASMAGAENTTSFEVRAR